MFHIILDNEFAVAGCYTLLFSFKQNDILYNK